MVQTIRDILSRIRAGTTTEYDADVLLEFFNQLYVDYWKVVNELRFQYAVKQSEGEHYRELANILSQIECYGQTNPQNTTGISP